MPRSSSRFLLAHGFAWLLAACLAAPSAHAATASAPQKTPADAPAAENTHAVPPPIPVLRGLAPLSLQSSGLLDYLAPYLTQDTGLTVVWTAAGDSQTLALARVCAGDVLLAATAEIDAQPVTQLAQLIQDGYGLNRQEVMRDAFVLAGPSYDPAGVLGLDIVDALRAIADKHAPFASRGDASGVNRRELALWEKADRAMRDGKNGYVEVGQDMMMTLDVAAAAQAYVLADRASFLTWAATHDAPLTILTTDKPLLERTWSIIPLNQAACPPAKTPADAAFAPATPENVQTLVDWWTKPSTQQHIEDFTREGQTMFTPALHSEAVQAPRQTSGKR